MLVTASPPAISQLRGKVKTRLLLARHGETEWNRLGRWQGQEDIPLNSRGREQALALAARLRHENLAAVYSSTLRRSIETAQEIASDHRINVCRDERVREINLGAWQGMLYKEIAARYPELLRAWEEDPTQVRPPAGESIAELQARVLAALREIALAYPGETVCLIGHQLCNSVIRAHYRGISLREALRIEPAHAVCESIDLPHPLWG